MDNGRVAAVERLATERFAVSRRALLGWLYVLHGRVWTWVMAVAAAVPAVLAVCLGDWRWVVVALMVVCILVPMVMALLYVNYALDAGCAFNVLPHTLSLCDDGVRVRMYVPVWHEEGESGDKGEDDVWGWERGRRVKDGKKGKEREGADGMDREDREEREVEMVIGYERLGKIRVGMDSVAVAGSGRTLLVIPVSAAGEGWLEALGVRL